MKTTTTRIWGGNVHLSYKNGGGFLQNKTFFNEFSKTKFMQGNANVIM